MLYVSCASLDRIGTIGLTIESATARVGNSYLRFKPDLQLTIPIPFHLYIDWILLRPDLIGICYGFPPFIIFRRPAVKKLLPFSPGFSCIININICSKVIRFSLKNDLCNVLSPDQIYAFDSRGVDCWDLLAFQDIHTCPGNVDERIAKLLIVFLLSASAALIVRIHQDVIRNIQFGSAVASAVPDHKTFSIPFVGGVKCCQPTEFLPGDIDRSVIPLVDSVRTMGAPAGYHQCSRHIIGISAGTFTVPPDSAVFLLVVRTTDDSQFPEGLTDQIMSDGIGSTLLPKTSATLRRTVF